MLSGYRRRKHSSIRCLKWQSHAQRLREGRSRLGRRAYRDHRGKARLKALGIEYNPDMVELSKRNAAKEGVSDKATFAEADLFERDFSQAQVITMFLPSINLKLAPKILDLKPGTRIVSNSFDIEVRNPTKPPMSRLHELVHRPPLDRTGQSAMASGCCRKGSWPSSRRFNDHRHTPVRLTSPRRSTVNPTATRSASRRAGHSTPAA